MMKLILTEKATGRTMVQEVEKDIKFFQILVEFVGLEFEAEDNGFTVENYTCRYEVEVDGKVYNFDYLSDKLKEVFYDDEVGEFNASTRNTIQQIVSIVENYEERRII
jgi:hypothetical protein